ncbi:hypothetical protein GC163_20255 [bacterium]|nr:hypothetical protein [bacterium]
MYRFLIAGIVFIGTLANSGDTKIAEAAVEGNSYSVTVHTNFTTTFTDVLTFNIDGTLTAQSGAAGGQWTESGQTFISNWQGNLSTISLSGVQIGPLLFGSGSDGRGHSYVLFGRQIR